MNQRPIPSTVPAVETGDKIPTESNSRCGTWEQATGPRGDVAHKADSLPSLVVESGGESPTESKQSMWAGRRPKPHRWVTGIESGNNREQRKLVTRGYQGIFIGN